MTVQRIVQYPALGKVGEFREVLEKGVAGFKSQGLTAGLMSRVLIDGGAEFSTYIGHENMEDFEKFRGDGGSLRDLFSPVASISRRGPTIELFEPVTRATGPAGRFYHRAVVRVGQNNMAQAREILQEYTAARQAEGRSGARLTRQVLSPKGVVFIVGDAFESLLEYENELVKQRPASVAAVIEKITPILESPIEQGMYEVLISPQS